MNARNCINLTGLVKPLQFPYINKKNLIKIEKCFSVNHYNRSSCGGGGGGSIANKSQKILKHNVFDRKCKLLQREKAASSKDVEVYDYLKEEIGYRVSDRIFNIKRKFDTVIDLGSSRGYVSKNIDSDTVKNLIMVDNSELLLSQSFCNDPNVNVKKVVCDEEHLEDVFQPETIDMVISNLALHWVNDLPDCFKQVNKILKVDGVFLGSMFGIDTLYELRYHLQKPSL